jgi:hypothetical protein
VRAEPLVEMLVPALAGEVDVELAEGRRKGVRVADGEDVAVRVGDLQLVAERQVGVLEKALEEAGLGSLLELDGLAARGLDDDLRRVGPERTDDDAAVLRVRAERRVRVVQLDQMSASRMRTMPATGMPTQSGRLLSS